MKNGRKSSSREQAQPTITPTTILSPTYPRKFPAHGRFLQAADSHRRPSQEESMSLTSHTLHSEPTKHLPLTSHRMIQPHTTEITQWQKLPEKKSASPSRAENLSATSATAHTDSLTAMGHRTKSRLLRLRVKRLYDGNIQCLLTDGMRLF